MSDQSATIKHKEVFGPHWEQIHTMALNAVGSLGAYGGARPDGQASSLYLFDPSTGQDKGSTALEAPATALTFYDDGILVCGTSNGAVECWDVSGKSPKRKAAHQGESAILSIAVSADGETIYASDQAGQISALSSAKLKPSKLAFAWPAEVPCHALVADSKGQWLAAAGGDGVIRVYDNDAKLIREMPGHEGAIYDMLLHPQEHRLISTGADRSIRLWFLQGDIDFEDRAASGTHDTAILSLQLGPVHKDESGEDLPPRLITGAEDGSVKIWPLGSKRKPKTLELDTRKGAIRGLGCIAGEGHTKVLIASEKRVILGVQCNAKTEPEGEYLTLASAFHKIKHDIETKQKEAREKSLKELTPFTEDPDVYQLLTTYLTNDGNHDIRAICANILANATQRRPIKELRSALEDQHTKVRKAALETLRKLQGENNIGPLAAALGSSYADTRQLAIKGLVPLHKDSAQVSRLLFQSLQDDNDKVQVTALDGLETVYPSTAKAPNTKPHVHVLRTGGTALKREALMRIHRNKWTHLGEIQPLLAHLLEHDNESLRLLALDVLIAGEPKLAKALRERDEILDRGLLELDRSKTKKKGADAEVKETKKAKKEKPSGPPPSFDDKVLQPLLMAQMSREDDLALRASSLLAALQDLRAFGTLLRLSGQPITHYRVETAHALEQLQDPRVLPCLKGLLLDDDKQVRDAAFDSLTTLTDDPNDVADAALLSPHPDTRNRGLQKLLPAKGKLPEERPLALLEGTLSDEDEGVRNEAFKILWNAFKKQPERCLLPALKAQNTAMRAKAIGELTGALGKEEWAVEGLGEALKYRNKGTRDAAYKALIKIAAKDDPTPHQKALDSDDADLRKQAVEKLHSYKADAVKPLLLKAVGDDSLEVRTHALERMLKRFGKDTDLLAQTLEIPHWDVRLQVAIHLGTLGDARALDVTADYFAEERTTIDKLLPPYIPEGKSELDVLPEETQQSIRASRQKIIEVVEQLGLANGVASIKPLLDTSDQSVMRDAAFAITRCAGEEDLPLLHELRNHKDRWVRIYAAEGLVRYGDDAGLGHIHKLRQNPDHESAKRRSLAAYYVLGAPTEARVLRFLQDDEELIRTFAFDLLLAREWQAALAGEAPTHLSTMLSNPHPDIRLAAANALAERTDRDGFLSYVETHIASRWEVPTTQKGKAELEKATKQLPVWLAALTAETPQTRFAAATLLRYYRDPATFLEKLHFALRHLPKPAAPKPSKKDNGPAAAEYAALAFGTYADLLRSGLAFSYTQPALDSIANLVTASHLSVETVLPALRHAIEDRRDAALANAAFTTLRKVFSDADATPFQMAFQSPQSVTGMTALGLLSGQSPAQAKSLTIEAMQSEARDVRFKASEQLGQYYDDDSLEPMILALQSEHADVRLKVVDRLVNSDDNRVLDALGTALESDDDDLRLKAAEALAKRNQSNTFDVLVDFLNREEHYYQGRAIRAFVDLAAPGTAEAIIQRLDEDPEDSADTSVLIRALGELRQESAASWLIKACDENDSYYTREAAFEALYSLAGTNPKKRDNKALIESMRGALQTRTPRIRQRAIWMLADIEEKAVPTLIATAFHDRDEDVRKTAVDTFTNRVKKFKEPIEPLLPLLEHPDTTLRFEAASALAEHGRQEAFVTLFTNFQTSMDSDVQQRAVKGLGVLGDERAFAPLMGLWAEDAEYHAAQAVAAEALGRLAPKAQRAEVRELLDRLLKHNDSNVQRHAMRGLRYFDPDNAVTIIGQVVRQTSGYSGWQTRQAGAELLGELGTKETEPVLTRMLKDDDSDVVQAAIAAILKVFGKEDARIQMLLFDTEEVRDADWDVWQAAAEVVAEQADPVEVLKRLPTLLNSDDSSDLFLDEIGFVEGVSEPEPDCSTDAARLLQKGLLSRDPLPLKGIMAGLKEESLRSRTNAVYLLSQIGDKSAGKALKDTCATLANEWQDRDKRTAKRAQLWQLALWSVGEFDPASGAAAAVSALEDDTAPGQIKAQAALILGRAGKKSKAATSALQAALGHPQEKVRRQAQWALSALGAADKLVQSLPTFPSASKHLLPDAPTLKTLSSELLLSHPARRELMPTLLAKGESKLFVDMASTKDETAVRFAIHALARIADDTAIGALDEMRSNAKLDDEIRREAFRAFRRAKRAAQRQQTQA